MPPALHAACAADEAGAEVVYAAVLRNQQQHPQLLLQAGLPQQPAGDICPLLLPGRERLQMATGRQQLLLATRMVLLQQLEAAVVRVMML